MPSIDLTVAIPTYNGSKRLPAVLEQLKNQIDTADLSWEVIVADNNSRDDTAAVVKQYQQQWPSGTALRYTFVPEQGAAFARQRAVEIAWGRVVAFLDDDNIPAVDWVINVHRFAQANPQAGAFGSQIHGDFENPLPEEMKSMACFLAIVERGHKPHLYEPRKKILPPGAGLAVQRQAWLKHVPKRLFLNHKGKKAGLASEDLEAILHIQKAGWEIWYNPDMVVYHRIPNSRLQESYLRSLLRCVGLSRFYIRMLGTREWQRPLLVPAYIANDIRRLALHYIKEGQRSEQLSLSSSCAREYLQSTIASPFFLLKKAFQSQVDTRVEQLRFPKKDFYLSSLTQTFEQGSFHLYCQPVMGVTNHLQTPFQKELLVRLPLTMPAESFQEFWAFAEHHHLAGTIDRWVISKVFHDLKIDASEAERLSVSSQYSINLSQNSVLDPDLPNFIDSKLIQQELPAQKICFEIRTDVAIAHPKAALRLTNALREMGCSITLDSFGTRRISPHRISQLPVDFIKVNPRLLDTNRGFKAYANQFQDFLRSNKSEATLIAKGIESVRLLENARHLGISYAQGYQLSRPQIWSVKPASVDTSVG